MTFLPYELRNSSCLFVYLFILCFHVWYILILIMGLSYRSEWKWYFFTRIKIFVQNCRAFWVKSIFYIRGVFVLVSDPLLVKQKPPPTLSDCTGPDVFMCDQKDCIPNQLKCNGVNDCTNGLDEDIATCGKGLNCSV